MTKEAKALEIIKNFDVITDVEKDETHKIFELLPNSINTLEMTLKRYENIKDYDFLAEHYKELLAYSNKQDEILRIIKEKYVDMAIIRGNGDLEYYNERAYYKLTQAEFALLKEYFR